MPEMEYTVERTVPSFYNWPMTFSFNNVRIDLLLDLSKQECQDSSGILRFIEFQFVRRIDETCAFWSLESFEGFKILENYAGKKMILLFF